MKLEADRKWMALALELAARADHATSPNPMVGAVVVDGDRMVGEGFHHHAGGPHAETEALAVAGHRARDGVLYVTLEPCAHHGRTPPCVEAVIAAGIRRAVVAMPDPDLRVGGRGIDLLRAAGIEVTVGVCQKESRRLNEFYVRHRETGRPFVSAKFAMSLDGKIATRVGESRWITGPDARAHGHRLRHQHDAVMVGLNTVRQDDPELTSRVPDRPSGRQPLRVVLDSQLRLPLEARILNPACPEGGSHPTLVATTSPTASDRIRELKAKGADVVAVGADASGRVDVGALVTHLGGRGILSILVEGGAIVHGQLFAAGLVDRVYAYLAPIIIGGGRDAPGPVGEPGFAHLGEVPRLFDLETIRLGGDFLIRGSCSPAS